MHLLVSLALLPHVPLLPLEDLLLQRLLPLPLLLMGGPDVDEGAEEPDSGWTVGGQWVDSGCGWRVALTVEGSVVLTVVLTVVCGVDCSIDSSVDSVDSSVDSSV